MYKLISPDGVCMVVFKTARELISEYANMMVGYERQGYYRDTQGNKIDFINLDSLFMAEKDGMKLNMTVFLAIHKRVEKQA